MIFKRAGLIMANSISLVLLVLALCFISLKCHPVDQQSKDVDNLKDDVVPLISPKDESTLSLESELDEVFSSHDRSPTDKDFNKREIDEAFSSLESPPRNKDLSKLIGFAELFSENPAPDPYADPFADVEIKRIKGIK